jgi:hypothetical protein
MAALDLDQLGERLRRRSIWPSTSSSVGVGRRELDPQAGVAGT